MTIVVTGGGSGGHITPILAVASELKKLRPDVKIVYIGQKGDSLGDVPAKEPNIDETYAVSAGKFRRYHSEGLKQLLDLKTMLLNARDIFRVLAGIIQSRRLLNRIKPDMIFIKGGFVGVPVGLAASRLGLPYITHDSDAIPGLANRIIARWALKHAVALPAEVYTYPSLKTVTVGVPVTDKYVPVTPALKSQYRRDIDVPEDAPFLFVIGGGLGAQRINQAVGEVVPHLLRQFPKLRIMHGVGRQNETMMSEYYQQELSPKEQGRVRVEGFLRDVYRYSGAADVIVTRAGATNLAEFAVQGKACIVVPSPFLAAGHQLKNAAYLEEQKAALVITETELEENPNLLAHEVAQLLKDEKLQQNLGQNFQKFARPRAAHDLAVLLLEQTKSI